MKNIIVTGAGGGGSNNLIRAFRASEHRVKIIGTNLDRSFLARSMADHNFLIPPSSRTDDYVRAINTIIDREEIDLIVPSNDTEVEAISACRGRLDAPTFLPSVPALKLCRDKLALSAHLKDRGIPAPHSLPIESREGLPGLFEALGGGPLAWCRLRGGTGSRATLPVRNAQQLEFWLDYWRDMYNIAPGSFTLCEYLPGRDFACQTLWKDGKLLLAKTCERLVYLFGANTPSGTMSTPSFGKLVNIPEVNDVCERAVKAVDPEASGVFSIDLKENADRVPHVTEINAGRFFRISPVMNLSGRYNMAGLFLSLAFGKTVSVEPGSRFNDIGDEDTFWICDIEDIPSVITNSEIESRYERLDLDNS